MSDLKIAFRTLLKTPFVTGVAILSLALGIGANTAILSVFETLLLQPLPVEDPGALVNLSAPGPKPGSQSCNVAGDCEQVFSYAMFRDLASAPDLPVQLAAHRLTGANIATGNQTRNSEVTMVSGSYFPVLGVRPSLGRLIGPSDDEIVGSHPVAVLGHRFWEVELGADPDVVGSTIVVNGASMTVIGVAPPGFEGTSLGGRPDVFVPLTMRGVVEPYFDGFENRRSYWAYVFGRTRPGATLDQVRTQLNSVYRGIVTEVEAPLQEGMSEATLQRFLQKELLVEEGSRGQSSVRGESRAPLLFLVGITGVVLLIACANIANLLLARGAARGQEMAVRGSLGATRSQLLRQLMTESTLLAVMGGVASLLVAQWTLSLITSLLPPEAALLLDLSLRPSVLLFTAALSLGTGFLFGMYPSLAATRQDLAGTLRASSGQPSGARAAARFRWALVTGQIALSMALLVGAGLFIQSLANVSRVDLGLQAENVVAFSLSPTLNGYESERTATLFDETTEALAALPGVTEVSMALVPVMAGSSWGTDVSVEGFQSGPDVDDNSRMNEVGPGYFRTLGIPLLAGREFTAADGPDAPPVAIVNEAFARKFNLDGDVVGKRMSRGGHDLDTEIVGLVKDANYSDVKQAVPPLFFSPLRQTGTGFATFYLRTSGPPEAVMGAIPGVVRRLDPNLPVEELKTLEQQIRENVFMDRMIGVLSASFAALATLLAAIGLYGVMAYTVAQRTREIGLRMALGADQGQVQGMVLGQVLRMTLVGGAMGLLAAFALGRAAGSLLYGLEGHDPLVMSAVAVLLGMVAMAAGYLPARKASRVDPMQALRYE